eukprot:sb/3470821/
MGGPDLSHFTEFFSRQMGLNSFIEDPATKPCAYSNNTGPCWNGAGLASYQNLAYSYTIEEQRINPEGADLLVSAEQSEATEIMYKAIDLINKTIGSERLFPVYKWQLTGGTATPPIDMGRTEAVPNQPFTTGNKSRTYTVAREDGERDDNLVEGTEGSGDEGEVVESNAREVVNSSLRRDTTLAVTICMLLLVLVT